MSAEIIKFPIDQQLLFVRETARALERRQGEAADRYWKTACRRLYARLQVQGMADSEIHEQIRAFTRSVQLEMQRAASKCAGDYPKGAA